MERASKISKSRYLDFVAYKTGSGKTVRVDVMSRRSGGTLGKIRWFPAWRQYAFFPDSDMAFNPECLRAICVYIDDLMGQWRRGEHGRD